MNWSLIGIACLLCSCAETRLYENGQLVAVIQGDATNISLTSGHGLTFHADGLIHSTPTAAVYSGASGLVGAVATGVIGGIGASKAAPATAAAIGGTGAAISALTHP